MRYAFALIVAACGSTPVPAPEPPAPPSAGLVELSPALTPLAWLLGDWVGTDGSEHWVAVDGAIYGVSLLENGRWEVMIIDDAGGPGRADGVVRLYAMPGGMKSVEFRAETMVGRSVLFGNPAHDDPKKIGYVRTDGGLRATLHGSGDRLVAFDFTRGALADDAAVRAADVAFSADVGTRGVDAWVAAFAADGWMMQRGERVTGAAIGDMMRPVLSSGTLAWEPVAAGKRGAIGFTVGAGTFTGATPADGWRTTYVTIWKQQPDGGWKVLFDTGRPVNE